MIKRMLHLLESSRPLRVKDISSSLTDLRMHARVSSPAVQLQRDVSVPRCITRCDFAGLEA